MSKRLNSFSRQLTKRIIIIVLVIMAIISVLAFGVTASGIYSSFREHFADAIESISGNISQNLEKVEISAANVADELTWHLSSPEDVIKTLGYEIEVNEHLVGCGMGFVPDYFPDKGKWFEPYAVMTDDGPSVSDIGSPTHDYFQAEWFQSGLAADSGIWSKPYADSVGAGALLCTYSIPITSPEGKRAGTFGADLSLFWLADLLDEIDVRENKMGLLPSFWRVRDTKIYSFILGPEGEFIVHPDRQRSLQTRNYFDYMIEGKTEKNRQLGEAMCSGKTGEEFVRMDGRVYDVFYAPVSNAGWSMAIVVPLKTLLRPALVFGSAILLLMLLGLAVVFRICHTSIKKFTKPLVQLADSATEVARGKFDAPLPEIKTEDEIRTLRDSFEDMQQSLSKYISELTETTAQKASIEHELDIARKIQMSMLPMIWPAFPDRKDIDIHGSITPAKAVGGDLYDFCIRDDKLFFCIGDVSGKGVPASLVMAVISSMFRTLSTSEDGPDKLVSNINSATADRNESLMFVTLFVGELNLKTRELRYCNAGHNVPYVLCDGTPHELPTDANVPIGIVTDWNYSLQKTVLSPGSILFLFTDGLTEATRADGSLFREERVIACLTDQPASPSSQDIINRMKDAVEAFVGDAEQSDDLTMLVIKTL